MITACSIDKTKANAVIPVAEERPIVIQKEGSKLWKCSIPYRNDSIGLKQVQALDSKRVIAASNTSMVATVDGGANWTLTSRSVPDKNETAGLFFVSPDVGWSAVVKYSDHVLNEKGNVSTVFKTEDGGLTWEKMLTLEATMIFDIKFLGPQEGWIAGRKRIRTKVLTDRILLLHTNNGGETWEDIAGEGPETLEDFGTGIIPIVQNEAILLTVRKLYKIAAPEKKMTLVHEFVESPQTSNQRFGLSPDGEFWVAGGADSMEGRWGVLLVKNKAGLTKFTSDFYINSAVFLSENEILVSGYGSDPEDRSDGDKTVDILGFSPDGGKSWSKVCEGNGIPEISSFSKVDNNSIWAVGGGKVILLERSQ